MAPSGTGTSSPVRGCGLGPRALARRSPRPATAVAPRRPGALVPAGRRGSPTVRRRDPRRSGWNREDIHRHRRGPRALARAAGARARSRRAAGTMAHRGAEDGCAAARDDPRSAQPGPHAGYRTGAGDHRRIAQVPKPRNASLPHDRPLAGRAAGHSAHGDPGRERHGRRGASAPAARARRRAGRLRASEPSIAGRGDIDGGTLTCRPHRRGSHRSPAWSHRDDVARSPRPRRRPRTRGHRRPGALARSLGCLAGPHLPALGAGVESRSARRGPAPVSKLAAARGRRPCGRQNPGSSRAPPHRERHDGSARDVGTLRRPGRRRRARAGRSRAAYAHGVTRRRLARARGRAVCPARRAPERRPSPHPRLQHGPRDHRAAPAQARGLKCGVVHRVGRRNRPPSHGERGCPELVSERITAAVGAPGTSRPAHDRCLVRRARSVPRGARHPLRSAVDRCPAHTAGGPRAPTRGNPYPRGSRPISPRPAPGEASAAGGTDRGQVGSAHHTRPGRGAVGAVAGERADGRTIPVCRRRGRRGGACERDGVDDRRLPRPWTTGRDLADRPCERAR